ncbi:universal stress protein [Hyunsoonleella flava]|uniref:Universal stress protein n=1 Tax=Hyunsoonleella flava TaxID=2527939 RepID=A0A4Q9FHJ6_9FLAO|nr:universal stress protein [Hyunsoonleella flava]TBN04343.1 universal stress protein [Hyunsoonleella flava]
MKRKILLPTDFSKNAWQAISYALKIYKNETCDFYILNVFSGASNLMENLMFMEPESELYETAKLESENGLAKILDKLTLKDYHKSKHHFKPVSIHNTVVEAIKTTVDEKDIDMIVMGTKGKTRSRAKVFGSIAVEVMEKIRNCPVIVVPELAEHFLPKEIVFPTGFKTPFKKRELNHLINLTKSCGATIRVLHISTKDTLSKKQTGNKALLQEYFKDVPYTFHTLSKMDIPTAIKCFVESRDSNMIAFINKKHAFFGSILTHPLVKTIGSNSRVPILVMHDWKN